MILEMAVLAVFLSFLVALPPWMMLHTLLDVPLARHPFLLTQDTMYDIRICITSGVCSLSQLSIRIHVHIGRIDLKLMCSLV